MNHTEEWETPEPGVRRKVFAPGKELMMMEVHFETGATGALHSHPHEQFTYCVKGSFVFTIDGKEYPLQTGGTLSVPGGAVHGVVALEPGVLLDAFTPLRQDLLKS